MIKFKLDEAKVHQVINYLGDVFVKDNRFLTIEVFSQILFHADVYSLNNYYRYICGGHYIALNNIILNTAIIEYIYNTGIISKEIFVDKYKQLFSKRHFDETELSISDKESLNCGIDSFHFCEKRYTVRDEVFEIPDSMLVTNKDMLRHLLENDIGLMSDTEE